MNEISRELVKKIDIEVEKELKLNPQGKVNELAQPYIEALAKENNLDALDLFIDYMDHVAISSKRVALEGEGESMFTDAELENPNFRLY